VGNLNWNVFAMRVLLMRLVIIVLFLLSLNLLCPSSINAQADDVRAHRHFIGETESAFQNQLRAESRITTACSQSTSERAALMQQAERQRFTVRRVEFLGLTYTRDEVIRARLIKFQQEGDLFSRMRLVKALNSLSKLRREIYPVKLGDIEVHLNESEQIIDLTICFKPKRR
jgi:hypothetical protein